MLMFARIASDPVRSKEPDDQIINVFFLST